MTKAELVQHLLAQDRGASEAEDAKVLPTVQIPVVLTEEQCAATDDMADLTP